MSNELDKLYKKGESSLRAAVTKFLKTKNCWFYKTSDRFKKAIPDYILCVNGQMFAFELKRKGERPTPLQQKVLDDMEEAGAVTGWFDNIEDFKKEFLKWQRRL